MSSNTRQSVKILREQLASAERRVEYFRVRCQMLEEMNHHLVDALRAISTRSPEDEPEGSQSSGT